MACVRHMLRNGRLPPRIYDQRRSDFRPAGQSGQGGSQNKCAWSRGIHCRWFVPPAYLQFLQRFNMDATNEEFPFGCFATIWYTEVKTGGECGIMLCDAFHDPGHSVEAKREMRIKKVILMAADDIAAGEKNKRTMH